MPEENAAAYAEGHRLGQIHAPVAKKGGGDAAFTVGGMQMVKRLSGTGQFIIHE